MSVLHCITIANVYRVRRSTVPTFNSCAKCPDIPGIIHNRTPDHHSVSGACMRPDIPDLATKRSFDSQATMIIDLLGLYFGLSMGVCATRYWQTSGRLVQELNVCTVGTLFRCKSATVNENYSIIPKI